jgi:nucleoside-diphosphate-sugar epimerase
MANILVVGLGDIGFPVALALHERGHQVTGLKRQPATFSAPFPVLLADIGQPDSLRSLSTDYELLLFIVSPGGRQVESYQAVFYEGLKNLLRHFAKAEQSPTCLMVSSTSVYGQNRGEWVDESSETRPLSATAQWLLAAEQLLYDADQKHCVVRFSGIYGPGRDWLIRGAATAEPIQRQPPSYTNRIHQQDCVAVLLFISNKLLAGEPVQSCYLASDNDPAPLWDVMSWIADQYHYLAPIARSDTADAPQNKRCRNDRLTALGYTFQFSSYKDGYLNPAD